MRPNLAVAKDLNMKSNRSCELSRVTAVPEGGVVTSEKKACGDSRHRLSRRFSAALASVLLLAPFSPGQTDSTQTMRPVIRGRHAAVASMKAEATEAARKILDAGGNAFDAAVAGQAALAVSAL